MTRREATIELLTSPSVARLEQAMVERVRALASDGGRVALVAPTARLLDRARRALIGAAGEGGIVAGVELMHHRSLARRLLDRAYLRGLRDLPAPRLLSELEAQAVAQAAVAALPSSSALRRLCGERPRFVASLRRTLGELREALVSPEALVKELGRKDDLVLLFAAHEKQLAALLKQHDATDAAGHALQAAAAAKDLAAQGALPWTSFVHHGGYELVGAQAALADAVASALPCVVLAPSGAGPAHETSRRGLARWPGARAEERRLDEPHQSPTLLDTEAAFDEEASAEAGTLKLPQGAPLEAFHVRGARAEVELAARLCAEAHLGRGVPLEDIAVVARSLEPYAGHLEAAFGAHGVPFSTSAGAPLLREPWARAALTLLEALAEDLPRPLVIELVRSPWAVLDDKTSSPEHVAPGSWDEWTLAARVVRGAAAFRDDTLAWHEADILEQARRREVDPGELAKQAWAVARSRRLRALGEVVARLEADRVQWTRCPTHGAHAMFLRELVGRWLGKPDERTPAARSQAVLLAVLDDLARLDALPADGAAAPDHATVRRLVADALAAETLPIGQGDGSGVRVLSAMPARAIPFREVVVIGLGQGAFPRRPRHDPFLRDDARLALRAQAPALGVKREAREEERQLLALLLGAATERLHVAWQRADDDGGVKAPSLFLREIARLTLGRPDLDALTARKAGEETDEQRSRLPLMAVPGHPAAAARALRERFGRATFRDAVLEAAERAQRRRSVEAVARHARRLDDGLLAGLQAVSLLDAFELDKDPARRAAQLEHDALLGPGVVPMPEPLSASSLQSFGRCALQWFFERALSIPQRDEEPDDLAVGADELGTCVHGVLEEIQRRAIGKGGDPAMLCDAGALALLESAWESSVAALAGARRERARLAWDALSDAWLSALERFVEQDAERLAGMNARIVAAEQDLHAVVEIAHGGEILKLPLRGRVDRIVQTPAGWQVEDFKTRANVAGHVDKARVLKGTSLQGLTYLLLGRAWAEEREHPQAGKGEAEVSVAFVPVHPASVSAEPEVLDVSALEVSWSETLAVIGATWRAGAFALKKTSCDWCAFTAACRRDHGPTRARLAQVPQWRDYLDLSRKSTKKGALLLSDIRAAKDAGGASGEDES